MNLKENERIDDLEYNNLKIIQNDEGFCFGIDSVLISDFAKKIKNDSTGVDLGTGTGIISILLAAKTNLKKIIGIEIQKDVADMAKRSVELNRLENKIEIINMDLKDILNLKDKEKKLDEQKLDALKPNEKKLSDNNRKYIFDNDLTRECADFIVTNPPYKKLETGKVSRSEYKYISRHEVTANLEDFIKVSRYLLKDKGSFFMVHRPDRLVDIIDLMRKYKLEPKKMRFVYSYIDKKPVLVLIKGIKNARPFLKIEKPLIIYNENGEYTDEIYKIYDKKRN